MVQFEYIRDCEHYGLNASVELCQEKAGLARMTEILGCLPLEFTGKHSPHYCVGSPLSPNKTKVLKNFVKKIENFCAVTPCTKVANIMNTILFYNTMQCL